MDSTINWTSDLSEGTPIPDYYWFRRDSEIARTEYISTYLHNLLYYTTCASYELVLLFFTIVHILSERSPNRDPL